MTFPSAPGVLVKMLDKAVKLTRLAFGRALSEQLDNAYDPARLARWAYRMHLDAGSFEPGLEAEILKVVAMEQGLEFEMSEAELRTLASALQRSQ